MTISLQALLLRCNRCQHQWLRRQATDPQLCPACRSKFWNQPRVRKIRRDRMARRRRQYDGTHRREAGNRS